MTAPPEIPGDVLQRQREASDPTLSAWVSANAGSGKTYVLAQRVIRLLLGGTPPGKILCLTFTKAAAANMSASVFDTLARWTALDDEGLDAAVHTMSNEWPSPGRRAAARRLFAQAIETPAGLKVQTIHAFCTRLLQQFPFEANVAARFTVLDDRSQAEMFERATMAVLLRAAGEPASPLGRALKRAVAGAADVTFRAVIHEAIAQREKLIQWVDAAGSVERATAELSAALGIDADDDLP